MAYERRKTKVELLSPAGDMECLNMALTYGADAIYLAGQEFGMRTASANFSNEQLAKAVQKAHEKNVPVFLKKAPDVPMPLNPIYSITL